MSSQVKGVLQYEEFGRADYVIEAAVEDVGLKQRLFSGLHARLACGAAR